MPYWGAGKLTVIDFVAEIGKHIGSDISRERGARDGTSAKSKFGLERDRSRTEARRPHFFSQEQEETRLQPGAPTGAHNIATS